MTKSKAGADAPEKNDEAKPDVEVTEQQPSGGGAFVRLPDGSLKREEG